jgi:hypothetical protein
MASGLTPTHFFSHSWVSPSPTPHQDDRGLRDPSNCSSASRNHDRIVIIRITRTRSTSALLESQERDFTARTNIAQKIHATPIIRNEAAWPRMKSICRNRPHGLIYMRATRRGRIFALSTKPYRRWLSNLGSASGWDSSLASSKPS